MSTESEIPTLSPLQLRQRRIDNLLNKMVLDISVFSVIGWTLGIGAGLFFTRQAPIRYLLAGVGGGYGFVNNRMHIQHLA
jgi:hypothetical protein